VRAFTIVFAMIPIVIVAFVQLKNLII